MVGGFLSLGPGQLLEEPQNLSASSGHVWDDLDVGVCVEHSGFFSLVSSYSSS